MHPATSAAWYDFIRRYEGEVAFMYLDTKGLVTVGIGNLIDPVALALPLPFQFKAQNELGRPAGRAATRAEIEAEWSCLESNPNRRALISGGHRACEPVTNLELSPENRRQLFETKSAANERQLIAQFPDFQVWPADAQLGLLAMAWGLGAAFPERWPKFSAACRQRDFAGASAESTIRDWRAERNIASCTLFSNAAAVLDDLSVYTPSLLYYPKVLGAARVVSSP
jgi:GH24 family phage-related lysozyme (muramidase)